MDEENLVSIILDLLHQVSGIRPPNSKPSLHLLEYGIDSILAVELAMMVEEHFGVEIPNFALSRWTCIDDIVRFLKVSERCPESARS